MMMMAQELKHVLSIEINAPIQAVWREITKRGEYCAFMFGTVFHSSMQNGAPYRYSSKNGKYSFVAGDVVEVQEPTKFSYTFAFTQLDDAPALATWELEDLGGNRTRVTITHSGFDGETKTYKMTGKGWKQILQNLKDTCEMGKVSFGQRMQLGMMSMFTFMMPKRCLTKNVEARRAKQTA
ncbi:MAG: SRPBCC domain-containing protein [Phycisphaerales bacterium]|nr:SRPBCC domain-containing protein [Phycisphaerales bacterium]